MTGGGLEVTDRFLITVSSIDRSPNMLKNSQEHIMPIMKLLLFIFRDGNSTLHSRHVLTGGTGQCPQMNNVRWFPPNIINLEVYIRK